MINNRYYKIMRKIFAATALSAVLIAIGCGGDKADTNGNVSNTEATAKPDNEASDSSASDKPEATAAQSAGDNVRGELVKPDNVVADAVQVGINDEKKFQTIEGFGAGFTYYSSYVFFAQYKSEVYDLLFKDANISILRFKNAYKYEEDKDYNTKIEKEIYEEAKKRLNEKGISPLVLMSSWSPAPYLKDSESLYGIGTIAKDKEGKYKYKKLGKYFADMVQYYRDNGVPIDYVSIQNEPDYVAAYESCTFSFMEKEDAASYADAFLAVYDALQKLDNPPKMLGPETMSCEGSTIKLYISDILNKNPESFAGIAHHLYVGGDETSPRSFNKQFRSIAMDYPDMRKWMTEYYRGDFMYTVQMIQNSLTIENLNSYIFWGGVWKGAYDRDYENMIGMDSGSNEEEWSHEHGYTVGEKYYAMRHFSEYILPGYERVSAVVDTNTINEPDNNDVSTDDISCSAYMSPEKDKMVLVAINDLDKNKKFQFATKDFKIGNSKVILTDYSKGQKETNEFYVDAGTLDKDGCFEIPAHSIVTVVIDKE